MGGATIRTPRFFTILLSLSLLIIISALVVHANAYPVEVGAQSWEYSELTKSFNNYLNDRNGRYNALLIAIFFGLTALLVVELMRRVRGVGGQEEVPIHSSASSTEAEQRRAWARIESSLMCNFVVTRSYDPSSGNGESRADKELEMVRGLIVDLSGGGCKIATSQELRAGDELELILELEPGRKLTIKGQVTRTEKETDSDQTLAGVHFKELREAVRDQIIAWMFKHQQSILEGQRRLAEGLCLRCGKPLSEGMRQQTLFCSKCNRLQNQEYQR